MAAHGVGIRVQKRGREWEAPTSSDKTQEPWECNTQHSEYGKWHYMPLKNDIRSKFKFKNKYQIMVKM